MRRFLIILTVAAVAASAAMNQQPKKRTQEPPNKVGSEQPAKRNTSAVGASPAQAVKRALPSSLSILYTACANGQIRSCNCTKFRYGGYGREMTLLKSIRAECKNVVLVEGGDTCGWTGLQAKLKAEITARALGLLRYDAMVPGEEELGIRGARYIDFFDPQAVPIVCANIFASENDAKPVYPPHVVLTTAGGVGIGVLGLVDVSVRKAFVSKSFEQIVREPAGIIRPLVDELRRKADLIVVVYHAPVDEARKLASLDCADVIISTHHSGATTPFASSESNEVEVPVEVSAGSILIDAATKNNWSLGRIDLELAPDGKVKSAKHRLLYLDRRYEEDPEMVKVYDEYNAKVKQAVLTNSAKLKEQAEALLIKRGLDPDEMRKRLRRSVFAGAEKCKDCHKGAYACWTVSRHARAIGTLEKTNQDYDPECVTCHATGVLVRNGFSNPKDTPELVNVQCEACHGPGLAHSNIPIAGYGKTGEQICRSCHTNERTPDFDYETAWAKVRHSLPVKQERGL